MCFFGYFHMEAKSLPLWGVGAQWLGMRKFSPYAYYLISLLISTIAMFFLKENQVANFITFGLLAIFEHAKPQNRSHFKMEN